MNRLCSGRTPRLPKSYSRDVPGEGVQIDTVKIAPGLFQFTAVDDCTRLRVLALYPSRRVKAEARNVFRLCEYGRLKGILDWEKYAT